MSNASKKREGKQSKPRKAPGSREAKRSSCGCARGGNYLLSDRREDLGLIFLPGVAESS